jgi:hypothetical protein
VHFALRLATNARDEATERDGLLVLKNVLEVLLGIVERATLEGMNGLTGILKRMSKPPNTQRRKKIITLK